MIYEFNSCQRLNHKSFNPNKEIIVHPYDDRGMEVISRNTSALAGLYERHNNLLIDYDMEAMRETFAPA